MLEMTSHSGRTSSKGKPCIYGPRILTDTAGPNHVLMEPACPEGDTEGDSLPRKGSVFGNVCVFAAVGVKKRRRKVGTPNKLQPLAHPSGGLLAMEVSRSRAHFPGVASGRGLSRARCKTLIFKLTRNGGNSVRRKISPRRLRWPAEHSSGHALPQTPQQTPRLMVYDITSGLARVPMHDLPTAASPTFEQTFTCDAEPYSYSTI
ncbi:hypothetical protein Bbelb_030880 [Branchiostoma belcheri]|nr:hypothetical protein Bbelb_030880 [Branchiostoma belcheri]